MHTKKINILFLVSGFPSDSHPQRGIFNYVACLEVRKYVNVEIIKISAIRPKKINSPMISYKELAYKVVRLPILTPISEKINESFLSRKFRSYLFKRINVNHFDIIHAVGGGLIAQLAHELSISSKKPYIVQYTGSDVNFYLKKHNKEKYIQKVIDGAAHHIFNSRNTLEVFSSFFTNVYLKKTIYRGVDLNTFKYSWNSKSKYVRVLFLGGITDGDSFIAKGDLKGGITLLKVWIRLNSLLSGKAKLFFAGPNSEKQRIATEHKWVDNIKDVEFLGPITKKEVVNQLKSSHIVVIPSHAEGLPNVLMEAMASGNLVIASRVGGIPEIIQHGENGFLLEWVNEDLLEDALIKCITHINDLKFIALNAKSTVKQYSHEIFGIEYCKIYNTILNA